MSLSFSDNLHSSVSAALSSVFPHTELNQFLTISRKDREKQISELTQITTGIRLFNRDCQKGGEGIEDRKCDLKLYSNGQSMTNIPPKQPVLISS